MNRTPVLARLLLSLALPAIPISANANPAASNTLRVVGFSADPYKLPPSPALTTKAQETAYNHAVKVSFNGAENLLAQTDALLARDPSQAAAVQKAVDFFEQRVGIPFIGKVLNGDGSPANPVDIAKITLNYSFQGLLIPALIDQGQDTQAGMARLNTVIAGEKTLAAALQALQPKHNQSVTVSYKA
jgi:hypothetical protein